MRLPVNRHRVWQLVFDAVLIVAEWRLTNTCPQRHWM